MIDTNDLCEDGKGNQQWHQWVQQDEGHESILGGAFFGSFYCIHCGATRQKRV